MLFTVTLHVIKYKKMRLHKNLCFATVDGLLLIFNEGHYADKVVQQLLKRDKRLMILYDGNVFMQKLQKLKNLLTETKFGVCLPFGLH